MWRRTVMVLYLLAIDHSWQLDSNATEPVRCCPCPEPGAAPEPAAPRSAPGAADCACARDAEAAASMFFPQAVRAFGNALKPDPKEDPKPLLHPEVDLASSVLETLREVTDEEYRDALERDAARAASSDVVHFDDAPAEARNVVTIIVSPQDMDGTGTDDVISEASHVQETRCIHPSLGSARDRSPVYQNGLDEILNLPLPSGLIHRQRDSNLAASDVHASVVKPENNLNRLLSGLKLRSNPGVFRLNKNKFTPEVVTSNRNLNEDRNLQNVGRIQNSITSSFQAKDQEVKDQSADVEETSDIDSDCEEQSVSREETFERNQPDSDSDPSPNNIREEFIEKSERQGNARENEIDLPNSKFSPNEPLQKPFPLKNLFKLKDVELIPLDIKKKIPKSKLNIPDLKFDLLDSKKSKAHSFDPVKIPKLVDLFRKSTTVSKESVDDDNKENRDVIHEGISGNDIGKEKEFSTEILDAVPSPTDINSKTECLESHSDKSSNNEFENVDDLLDNKANEDIESRMETDSDSIRNDDDLTNITGLESIENIGTTTNERNEINDPDIPENFEQNRDTELLVISSEEVDDVPPSAIELSEPVKPEERSQDDIDKHHPLKTLEEIRRSVIEKLDALQTNNRNALNNIKQSMEEISEKEEHDSEEVAASRREKEISDPSLPATDDNELKEASSEEISFADLQNMSDSILEASEKSEHLVTPTNVDPQDSEEMNTNENISNLNDDLESEQESESAKNKETKLCPSDLVKPSVKEASNSDLEPLASEPISHSIFRSNSKSLAEHLSHIESKLRQNLIVQPASLINTDSLNIFRAPTLSLPDISELNTNLPTLGEIRTRVSEILSGLARQSEDDDLSSEWDSDDFSSNISPVLSTGASSSNPVSIFSPLQPLKDINLDIVQLKPIPLISGTNPLRAAFPGLNLNTYRAKLAVPKTLDLKPLNLASTLGTGGGLLGARLSIEPERKDRITKNKGKAKNAFAREQTFQASNVLENIAENIKSHTENSMKNIHQSFNSPLKNARAKLKNPAAKLSHAFNVPQSNIHNVVDNFKAQTKSAFRNIESLSSPSFADITDSGHKTAKSSAVTLGKGLADGGETLDSAVKNLLSQTESALKNIQQTNLPSLSEISHSIQKTAKNALKSSKITTATENLKSTLQPSLSLEKVMDNLRSPSQNIMRNTQNPLSTAVQKHAQDLLKSSNTLGNMLQAPAPIDLKPHAEKVVKDLQKTLKATLRNSAVSDLQPLPNPENIVQMITNHQEDFNEKLFAIHTDLNDRLESLHNEMMDTERLKSILSPPSNFDLFAIPLPSNRMTENQNAALKTKQPSENRKFKETSKPVSKASVSRPKPGVKLRASTGKENDSKIIKMSNSASAPVSTQTKKTVLPLISKKPAFIKSSDRDSTKNPLLSHTDTPKTLHGLKKPLLTKHKSLGEKKTKVTFGSTTPKSPKTHKLVESSTAKPKVAGNKRFKPKPPVRQPTPWSARTASKPNKGDPVSSPSRIVPKVRTPSKHSADTRTNKGTGSGLGSASRLKPQRLPKLQPQPIMKLTPASQARAGNRESKLMSPEKPTGSLLSKLTEALKNKHTKAHATHANLRSPGPDLDAAPAPSDHVEKVVALGEPMKENVSYKCKMMCVKVSDTPTR